MEPNGTGESLLAVLGVDPLLGTDPIRFTADMREKADRLPLALRREIRRFVNGEAFDRPEPLTTWDYHEALTALTKPQDPNQMVGRLAGTFRNTAEGVAFSNAAGNALAYLRSILPLRSRDTITGPVSEQPNGQDLAQFRRAHAIANDPLLALADLNEGILSRDQVKTLSTVYPALYQLMQMEVFVALRDARAAKASFDMTNRRQLLLETFMGATTVTPALGQLMQKAFAQADQDQPSGPGARPLNLSQSAEASQTQTQRIEAK